MPIIASSHITASGQISGSANTTGSFGHLIVSGDNFDTAVSSSAAASGFGTGGGGGSGISNVVEDTTPQLGGNLDLNSKNIIGNGGISLSGSLIISGTTVPTSASLHITDTSFTDTHILSQSLVVAVDGNNGRLFSVTDQMTGSLFSANTVAGLPVIEAFSDNKVTLGPFSSQVIVDSSGNISGSSTSTASFGQLEVGGGTFTSASLAAGGSGGGSGISNVVEDTTPQLGGDLDLNSNDVTGTGNINIVGNISGSATSTGSFGKLEVGSQIRLIEGDDSFIKGGDFGIGTSTPVARLEIEDDGTSNSMLLKLTVDDTNVYGMVFGNDTFSTTDTDGGQHILSNDGTYIIRTLGSGTATRIGAGTAYNNYNYLEITGSIAKFTTTTISGSSTSTGSFGRVEAHGGLQIPTVGSLANGILFGDGDTGFYETADDDVYFTRGGNTVFRANTSSQIDFGVSTLFYNTTGGFNIKTGAGAVGTPNYTFRGDTDTGMYRSAADKIGFTAGGALQLEVTTNKISGSSTSTGSFGHIMKGGVNFDTAVSSSAAAAGFGGGGGGGTITALNNQTANRLVTIGSTTTELDGEANLTFDGSTLTVNGDIILDDGGSLKEAGGTAAITFDGSGNVTKIGQDSPSSDEVLTWDGSKWVAAAAAGGQATGGSGLFGAGTTQGGILVKAAGDLTGSFVDNITIRSGSLHIVSGTLQADFIGPSGDNIDINSITHQYGSKDAGYASGYGFDGSVNISSYLYGITFSPDGKTLMVLNGSSGRTLYQFELKTPWDVRTQQYVKSTGTFSANETGPLGMWWHPDGLRYWLVGSTLDGISEYAVDIPWTLGKDQPTFIKSMDNNLIANNIGDETTPRGVFWKPDGTRVYIIGGSRETVMQYHTTGSAFDIGALNFIKEFDVDAQENAPQDVHFDKTGTQMFVVGTQDDEINQYHLSQSWDVGTARHIGVYDTSTEESNPFCMFLRPDNSEIYIGGSGADEINVYTISGSRRVSTTTITGDVKVESSDFDFKESSYLKISSSLELSPKADVNINTPITMQSSSMYLNGVTKELKLSSLRFLYGSKDGGYASGYGFDGGVAHGSYLWDMAISPDGKTLITLDGGSGRTLYQFELKTPFDLRTQQYVKSTGTFSTNETGPLGMWWHPDGLRFWLVGSARDGISEYSVDIPWRLPKDEPTFVKSMDSNLIDGGSDESTPSGIVWKPDGTKVFVVGYEKDTIQQYAVTGSNNNFNIHALKQEHEIPVLQEETTPTGIQFTSDGSQMFVIGYQKDELVRYKLSKNWDISTARFKESINIGTDSGETNPYMIYLSYDQNRLYTGGSVADEVQVFEFDESLYNHSSSLDRLNISTNTDIYGNVDVYGKLTLRQSPIIDTEPNFEHGLISETGSIKASSISNPIDITKLLFEYGSKDGGYASGYGFDGGVSHGSYLWDMAISPDGKTLMTLDGSSGRTIYQFSLKTPFDLRTQEYESKTPNLSSNESSPLGMWWHPDGLRFWLVGSARDGISEYSVDIPWRLPKDEPTFVKSMDSNLIDGGSDESTPSGIVWKPDGTKVFVVGYEKDTIQQYAVTGSNNNFNIHALKQEHEIPVLQEETTPTGIQFTSDGSQMFVIGYQKDEIIQYDLSKNWDISTARVKSTFNVGTDSGETTPYMIYLSYDQKKFYTGGSIADEVQVFKLPDANTTSSLARNKFTIASSTDVYGDLDVYGNVILRQTPTFKTEPEFTHGLIAVSSSFKFTDSSISSPIDLSTAEFKQSSADPETIGDIYSIHFRPDGRRVILMDDTSVDKIYQYDLSIPWDVSSLDTTKKGEFSISSFEGGAYAMNLSTDGSYLFIVGADDDGINSFRLSTPFDITTATHERVMDSNKIAGGDDESQPSGIVVKPDGTKFYLMGYSRDTIQQYAVTGSLFNINSLKQENELRLPPEHDTCTDLKFTGDGSQMFILASGDDEIVQYDLSKNWDISTARKMQTLSVNAVESAPRGFFIKPDNSKMYVVGTGGEKIHEFTFGNGKTGANFRNSQLTASANTLDMSGQVNLFGSMDVQQDINVFGYVDGNLRGYRPIVKQNSDFTCTTNNSGFYFRVGGNITCSIAANVNFTGSGIINDSTGSLYAPIGTEWDFFQTSSAGNFLFESASGVTVNVKNNNMNLAGQFSSATLKKVDDNEWDLMGDLT